MILETAFTAVNRDFLLPDHKRNNNGYCMSSNNSDKSLSDDIALSYYL